MIRAHKIELKVNNKQATYLKCVCGCVRKAYNVGINRWKEEYLRGGNPTIYGIRKWFNTVKDEKFPYFRQVTKFAYTDAFARLDDSIARWRKNKSNFPRYKKKGYHDRFTTDGAVVKVQGRQLYLPRVKWIRMTEELRFNGKILSVTVSEQTGRWYASFNVEMADQRRSEKNVAVGVALNEEGALNRRAPMISLSDGTNKYHNPYSLLRGLEKIKSVLTRKEKGSNNWKKTTLKLQKKYDRLANARKDAIHKMTTETTNRYSIVCLEEIDSASKVKNRLLAKKARSAGFGEIKRQFSYKANKVITVAREERCLETCPNCGNVNHRVGWTKDAFSDNYVCKECGFVINLGTGTALNLLREGLPNTMRPSFMETVRNLGHFQKTEKRQPEKPRRKVRIRVSYSE